MCIAIACFAVCDVIDLEINLIFLLKQKAFFIIFKGLSVANNCLRLESVPLKENDNK